MTDTREDARALIATDQAQLLLSGLWDDYCEAGTANGSTDNGAIELYDIDGMFEAAHAIFDAATAISARADAQAGALLDQAAKKAFNAIAKFPLRTMVTNTDNATMLELAILSIAPDATAALERALVKAREEEQGRVVRIAAGLFPGGYDNNAARILAAIKPLGGDA